MAACGCQPWSLSQNNCLHGNLQLSHQTPCSVSLRRSSLQSLWFKGVSLPGCRPSSAGLPLDQVVPPALRHSQPAAAASGNLDGEQADLLRERSGRNAGLSVSGEAHLDRSHTGQQSSPPQTSGHGQALGLHARSLHAMRGDHLRTRAQSPRRAVSSESALLDVEKLGPGRPRGRSRPRSKWRTLEVVRDSSVDELEELYATSARRSRLRRQGPQQADGAEPRALIEELLSEGELRLVEEAVGGLPPSVDELEDLGGLAFTGQTRSDSKHTSAFELEEEGGFLSGDSDGADVWIGREEVLPEFAVERPGGRRVMELVAAWDALAPRLSADAVRSSAAQLLIGALKLTLPALQDALPVEGGRSRTARALAMASTLADLRMDAETIAAGLVREAVEAGTLSVAAVELQLGVTVGRLLHDSQRVQQAPQRADSLDDANASALRQFCLGFHDPRAVIVELAACLDSMRHLAPLPRWRQQLVALETLQVWAPLAHALGTGSLMWELEDSAFRILFPQSYTSMEEWLEGQHPSHDSGLEEIRHLLEVSLKAHPEMADLVQTVSVVGRRKSLYSTMKKLLRDGRNRHEVNDLLGLRVVLTPKPGGSSEETKLKGVRACYLTRQVASSLWLEQPDRFKDYVANPKRNNYQSLHMAVRLEEQGPMVELQIRTAEMDALAVHGAAAHGAYKGGLTDPHQVQQLREIVQAMADVAAAQYTTSPGQEMLPPVTQAMATVDVDVATAPGEMDHMFAMFDRNGDGRISMEEVREVISEVSSDQRGSPEDAEELMTLLDSNNDGSISAGEFAEFRRRVRSLRDLPGVDRQYTEELGSFFQPSSTSKGNFQLDRSSSGSVGQQISSQTENCVENRCSLIDAEGVNEPSATSAFQTVAKSKGTLPAGKDVQVAGKGGRFGEIHRKVAVADRSTEWASADATWITADVPPSSAPSQEDALSTRQADVPSQQKPKVESTLAFEGHKWERVYPLRTSDRVAEREGWQGDGGRKVDGNGHFLSTSGSTRFAEQDANVEDGLVQESSIWQAESGGERTQNMEQTLLSRSADIAMNRVGNGALNGAAKGATNGAANSVSNSALAAAGPLADSFLSKQTKSRSLVALRKSPQLRPVPQKAQVATVEAPQTEVLGVEDTAAVDEEVDRQLAGLRGVMKRRPDGLAKARQALQKLVKEHPLNANVWVHYAQLERKAGNVGAARSRYEQSVKAFEFWGNRGAQYMRALQAWGTLEAKSRRVHQARSLFKRALQAASQVEGELQTAVMEAAVVGLHSWAMLELRVGSWARARHLLERAESIQPGNAVVLQARALVEKRAHNWTAAREYFQLATKAAPEDAACWQAWAIFESEQGKLGKTRSLFKRALEADPSNIHTLQAWAHKEALVNTPSSRQTARELFKRCTQVGPEGAYAWQAWAVLEQQDGQVAAARELFEKGLHVAPNNVACLQGYALLEKDCGNLMAAQDLLARALAAEPANAAALMAAAQVEEALGNIDEAQEYFVRASIADKVKQGRKRIMFEEKKYIRAKEAAKSSKDGKESREPEGRAVKLSAVKSMAPLHVGTSKRGSWRKSNTLLLSGDAVAPEAV